MRLYHGHEARFFEHVQRLVDPLPRGAGQVAQFFLRNLDPALAPGMEERIEQRRERARHARLRIEQPVVFHRADELIVDEGVIMEIVRPGTGTPVPEGEVGEVLVSVLAPEYPLLRFATATCRRRSRARARAGAPTCE